MANGGEITFSTAIDNSQLEKDLKDTERDIYELENKLENATNEKLALEIKEDKAIQAIKATEGRIEALKLRMAELSGPVSPELFDARLDEMRSINEQLDIENEKWAAQDKEAQKVLDDLIKADDKVKKYTDDLSKAKDRADELGQQLSTSMKKSSGAMQQGMQSAGASMDMIGKRINTMIKKVFFFSIILSVLRALKDYLGEAMMENEGLRSSFEGLKASLAGLAQPLLGVLIPAVRSVINIFTVMVQTLGRIIDSLFHTNIAASIQKAKAAANATRNQTKAQKDLAKATKETNKQLMSFDELNQMQDNTQDSGAGGVGAGGGGGANWDAFDSGIIDEKLAEIMLLLGAAIMAVGAILCFSGVNIPLGITLMAIGALMMYSAVAEQWDNMPAHVQETITQVMLILGAALFVIGAILAFSGVNTMIGIGLMAAGALVLGAAVAINWNSMSTELQLAIGGLMAILGVAALAIGAILCFTGAAIPLGVALIIIGAMSLAAAVALNWNNIPNAIENNIDIIFAVVSVALLVLGAILCISGVALPVGIALIAIGAAALVTAATLAWGRMPDETRDFVGKVLAIAGAAFLVLGIILIITGVGLPIGIACILAGAAALVSGAAINWNFIQDKISDIWRGITSWWNSTVAPIFTTAFWADKFRSIVNGLIQNINRGLSAFGGFINGLASGISNILGVFGISWHASISMPQIPYLAQGAVIPPNRKFMAVLGDQSNGTNLEAPESLIRQIVREESGMNEQAIATAVQSGVMSALMLMGGENGDKGGTTEVVVQVGMLELARIVLKGIEQLSYTGEYKPEMQVV